MSIQTTATLLAAARRTHGRPANKVVALIFDGAHCHHMTEETLDAWWQSLTAEEKADVYEADLGPADDRDPQVVREVVPFLPTPPQGYPWSILEEAHRVSAQVASLVHQPLTATATEAIDASV